MKCSKCGKNNVHYKQKRPSRTDGLKKKTFVRTDWTIVCKNCGEFNDGS